MSDRSAIPRGQVRILRTEDDADTAGKAALLSLDDVTHAFVDAPLALGGMPRRDLGREAPEHRDHALPGGVEDIGDLGRGHAGTTRVTGFSMRRWTSAMNCAAVCP